MEREPGTFGPADFYTVQKKLSRLLYKNTPDNVHMLSGVFVVIKPLSRAISK